MIAAATDSIITLEQPSPGVRLVTLNQPNMRNAMTEELTAAWHGLMTAVAEDDTVRAMVVTGSGTSFCSGADLSWLDESPQGERTPARMRDKMIPFYSSWLAPRQLDFPVIAAVNGPAVGAGVCLALACDLRYGSHDAVFKTPFIYLGTHGGMGITKLLPEAVGAARAREMLFTGRDVPAEEALQWGLVTGVFDDVVAGALAVAREIASAAPIASRLTKVGLGQSTMDLQAALQWEALAQPITLATSDLHEGISARRENRDPKFEGR